MNTKNEHQDSGHEGNDRRRELKLKKQREDVSKILKKVQEAVEVNSEQDLDKTIDRGLILSRTSEGLALLFEVAPATWKPLFPLDFYQQIYRLNNWEITEESLKNRPGIIGTWTNWMIYIRFPLGTIKWLREQRINNGCPNSSNIKFHQFSTTAGRKLIEEFIASAIELMRKCNNWDQFKRLLAKGYGKTYQSDMFDKDEIDWRASR